MRRPKASVFASQWNIGLMVLLTVIVLIFSWCISHTLHTKYEFYPFTPTDALRHYPARHTLMPGGNPPRSTLCASGHTKVLKRFDRN